MFAPKNKEWQNQMESALQKAMNGENYEKLINGQSTEKKTKAMEK